MRLQTVVMSLGALLLGAGSAWAQTPEIQKEIEKKLGELKKEQAAFEELFAQALKNNAEIRVAESKLHEAEAVLYSARVTALNRIVALRNEIKGAQAAADEAASRYERDKLLADRPAPAISQAELGGSRAAMLKFKADVAVKEAELCLVLGKHHAKAADSLRRYETAAVTFLKLAQSPPKIGEQPATTAQIQGTTADKLRKILDTPFTPFRGSTTGSGVLDLLRKSAKGVNIQATVKDLDLEVLVQLSESIPLGAYLQWAEDQFGWRFVVRDYGIVVADRNSLPPGAPLLLDLWRQGKPATAK